MKGAVEENETKVVTIITDGNQDSGAGPYETQSECETAYAEFGSPAGWFCQQKEITIFKNNQIIKDYQTFYNLQNKCNFYSTYSFCNGGSFSYLYASSNGMVRIEDYNSDSECVITSDGYSRCAPTD